MPDKTTHKTEVQEPVDWTEANLSKVVSEIYAKAGTDKAFYKKLMKDPYKVLSAKIRVPEDFHSQVFARQANKKMVILNVPSHDESTKSTETPSAMPAADYQILCTIVPWQPGT